jgi:hypothetical protein
MTKAKVFLAGIAAAALIPAVASANPHCCAATAIPAAPAPSIVLNGQMQMNDAIAQLTVHARETAAVNANTLGVGNTMTAATQNRDMNVTSTQTLRGKVGGFNDVAVERARGLTLSTAVAQGNAAQVQGDRAHVRTVAQQFARDGTLVAAASRVDVGSSDTVVSAAQAAANNFAIVTTNGASTSLTGQYSDARVEAHSVVTACCNNESLTSSALAAGNSLSIAGAGSTVYAALEQKNYGPVRADSTVTVGIAPRPGVAVGAATNVTSAAAAAGNVVTLNNQWGYAQMDGYQENVGAISANSRVTLGDWRGFAVSGANAIGNSAILSNIGSDATMSMVQNNYGAVSSFASLNGSSSQGGVGMASSHAVGNAITAYACPGCTVGGGVKLEGYTQQYNYAPVSAVTSINVGTAGAIVGSATAVGNSASFIARTGGH